jgi:hypothetical protein
LITALFLVFVVYLQTSVLLETRRQAREIKPSRELADQAGVALYRAAQLFWRRSLRRGGHKGESQDAVLERVGQLDRDLRVVIEQSANSLAACVGELEDRLDKAGLRAPGN